MSVRFTHSGGYIDLPNPVLGDNEQLDIKTSFAVTMSKTVHSTKKTPSHSKFLLNFAYLKQTVYQAFITWYQASAGKSITYRDYNNANHVGTILNNPVELTMEGRMTCVPAGQKQYATLTVEFEAVNTL